MTDKEYILRFMYYAFLDIRAASYSQDSHTCFVLSDVFHTVPLAISRADKGEIDYAEIVAGIKQKCEARNCVPWLVNVTDHIAKFEHVSDI